MKKRIFFRNGVFFSISFHLILLFIFSASFSMNKTEQPPVYLPINFKIVDLDPEVSEVLEPEVEELTEIEEADYLEEVTEPAEEIPDIVEQSYEAEQEIEKPKEVAKPEVKRQVQRAQEQEAKETRLLYEQVLLAWLDKHKIYPRRARRMGLQGDSLIEIVIANNGQLITYKILENSGYEILDSAVKTMIDRASPFPEMPESMLESEYTFIVPISFRLNE